MPRTRRGRIAARRADTALYHSVLAAIAAGNTRRGGIASHVGRKSNDLSHPLTVLQDAGLIVRENDAFRANRTDFRINEPLLAFYHAIMRPFWPQLIRGTGAEQVWAQSAQVREQHPRPALRTRLPGVGPQLRGRQIRRLVRPGCRRHGQRSAQQDTAPGRRRHRRPCRRHTAPAPSDRRSKVERQDGPRSLGTPRPDPRPAGR